MRKGLIEALITSFLLGIYLFYNEPIIDFIKSTAGLEWLAASPYLYAFGGLFVFLLGFVAGKILTRGMK